MTSVSGSEEKRGFSCLVVRHRSSRSKAHTLRDSFKHLGVPENCREE